MTSDLDLLVVGMRKSGTSWLYENSRNKKNIAINEMVKETGFFGRNVITAQDVYKYDMAFSGVGIKAEFDASLCYNENYTRNIESYAKDDISLRLIVRNPIDYLVSRFIHSRRKGEIQNNSLYEAVENNKWLSDELEYKFIIEQFDRLKRNNKLILPFELLSLDPDLFTQNIFSDLPALESLRFKPDIVNQSRVSKYPMLSKFFAGGAKLSRKMGLHSFVNVLKSTGVNGLLEEKTDEVLKLKLKSEAKDLIHTKFKESLDCWESIYGCFS